MNIKLLILFWSLLFCSCFVKNKLPINKKNSYDFKIKFENYDYLGNINLDSIKGVRFRLYDNSGIKLTDFKIYSDSIKFTYCIVDEIEKSIIYYFNIYNKELIIESLLRNIFQGLTVKSHTIRDYNLDYDIIEKEGLKCNVSGLKNNLIINLNSKNYSLFDSTIIFNDVDIVINNKIKFQLLSINE
jgi:hypothetical protein